MIEPELLPVLLVVVPILAAALPLAIGRRIDGAGYLVSLAATVLGAVLAGALAVEVFSTGDPVATQLGGFAPPHGIELVVDGLSAFVVVLIAVVGVAVLAAGREGDRADSFYSLYLLLLAGLTGVAVTGDVFNLYVFLEISGLAAYALIGTRGDGRSALAALKYLIMGTVGASLYLIGVGYAYVATGTLNMADLAERLADPTIAGYGDTLVLGAFAFMATGFAIKIALFPVHTWQPDAYVTAPDRVTALVAALVSTTAAYALARIVLSVFTVDFFATNPVARRALLALAAGSVLAGSVLAVLQRDVKRMLAYSSVAQFGLIVIGVGLLAERALVGSIVHLVGHAIVKAGLFLGVAVFAAAYGVRTVADYDGLAERAPYASGAFAVLALALVGVPPTVGFVGKLYIAIGAVEESAWPLVAVVVVSTLLTLGYVMRLLERMYFAAPAAGPEPAATDGGGADPAPDGGDRDGGSPSSPATIPGRPSGRAILGVVVVAAVVSVALGFAGAAIESLLEPTVETLLHQ